MNKYIQIYDFIHLKVKIFRMVFYKIILKFYKKEENKYLNENVIVKTC